MANKQLIRAFKLDRRQRRVRKKIIGTAEKPRLCVFRSLNNIYAQLIDDQAGHTLVSCSSLDKEMAEAVKKVKSKSDLSAIIGEEITRKALEKGLNRVVFDRNRYRYHGRVKIVAESARKAGLKI